MAALTVLLFSTFAFIFLFSQQRIQHLPPQGEPLPGESLPLPVVSMVAESFPGSGYGSAWREGRGKSVPTDLLHFYPTAEPL